MKKSENDTTIKILISKTPNDIDYNDIDVNKNDCNENSIKIARKYPSVEIVEGVILIVNKNKFGQAFAHFWNKRNDIQFDVTNEVIWLNDEINQETKEIKYTCVKTHQISGLKNGNLEFCDETKKLALYLNESLKDLEK